MIDMVVGPQAYHRLPEMVAQTLRGGRPVVARQATAVSLASVASAASVASDAPLSISGPASQASETAEGLFFLASLPLFPYMQIEVMPLCRHPSAIHDDDR